MFGIRKIFLCTALCACAAVLFSSCVKQPERETAEDGRQILYLARPADEGDTYYAGSLKSEVNRLIYEFNHKSENYVIEEKFYESGEKLLLEIMSGRQPDLLYQSEVCSWVSSAPLYGKGLRGERYTGRGDRRLFQRHKNPRGDLREHSEQGIAVPCGAVPLMIRNHVNVYTAFIL